MSSLSSTPVGFGNHDGNYACTVTFPVALRRAFIVSTTMKEPLGCHSHNQKESAKFESRRVCDCIVKKKAPMVETWSFSGAAAVVWRLQQSMGKQNYSNTVAKYWTLRRMAIVVLWLLCGSDKLIGMLPHCWDEVVLENLNTKQPLIRYITVNNKVSSF